MYSCVCILKKTSFIIYDLSFAKFRLVSLTEAQSQCDGYRIRDLDSVEFRCKNVEVIEET